MGILRHALFIGACLALLPVHAMAATAQDAAKTQRQIPPLIPSETFVDPGYLRNPVISPDGTHLVFRELIKKSPSLPSNPSIATRSGVPSCQLHSG